MKRLSLFAVWMLLSTSLSAIEIKDIPSKAVPVGTDLFEIQEIGVGTCSRGFDCSKSMSIADLATFSVFTLLKNDEAYQIEDFLEAPVDMVKLDTNDDMFVGALGVDNITFNMATGGLYDFQINTVSVLSLAAGVLTFNAANPEILGGDTDGILFIAPSTTNALGGNILLYGDTHLTQARDIEFRATAGIELHYDDSASKWDFQANALDTIGVITFSGGGALTGTFTGETQILGNNTTRLATTAFVAAAVGTVDTLAEVLALGNLTGGTNIVVTVGDLITVDTINETTVAAGVTIDSILLKDSTVLAGTLTIAGGSITDSSGAISFGDETLTTTSRIISDDIALTPKTGPTPLEGLIYYDSDDKALSYFNDEPDVTINLGQEQVTRARNETGASILDGEVVFVSGSTGQDPQITKSIASANTARVLGVATHTIENNSFGYVTTFGIVRGIDTTAFIAGDTLFLSSSVAGGFTTTPPTLPIETIAIATVIKSAGVGAGRIFVHSQAQFLNEVVDDPSPTLGGNLDGGGNNITNVNTLSAGITTIDTTLVLAGGSITDTSGAISFGNENLSTTGTLAAGTGTFTGTLTVNDGTGSLVYQDVSQANLTITGANSTFILDSTSGVFPSIFIKKSGVIQTQIATIDGGVGLALYGHGAGGTNGLFVTSLFNVGIGVKVPTAKLEVLQGGTTVDGIDLQVATITTSSALRIDDLNALTTGSGFNLASNSASTSSRSLVKIVNDNTLATGTTSLQVTNDSTGSVATFTGTGGITSTGGVAITGSDLTLVSGSRVVNTAADLILLASNNNNLRATLTNQGVIGINNTSLKLNNSPGSVSIFESEGDTGTALASVGASTYVLLAPNHVEVLRATAVATTNAINLSGSFLTTGTVLSAINLSALSTGGFMEFTNTISASSLTARTAGNNLVDFNVSRTETRTTGATADDFDVQSISRTSIINGVGGTLTAAGSVLKLENISTQTAGTLIDTVNVLELVQSTTSTGDALKATGTVSIDGTIKQVGTNPNAIHLYKLEGQTTNAAQTELFITGTIGVDSLAVNESATFNITINAHRTDAGSESSGYVIKGVVHNNGGTTSLAATITSELLVPVIPWTVDVTADDTNDNISVLVIGEVGKTIEWTASVKWVKSG